MASQNAPKSSAELIRKHSHCRYIAINDGRHGTVKCNIPAAELQVRKYR